MEKHFFTSESALEGHPDKLCDQIADGILDAFLEKDPFSRVACDVSATTGLIMIYGQITSLASVEVCDIARKILCDIGYTSTDFGIDGSACSILTGIDKQSTDIAAGVNASLEYKESPTDEMDRLGAGDQGLMFGFACRETPELMPMPITLAHRLAKKLADTRKSGELPYLRPDGKTQVTVEYLGSQVKRVDTVVIACQHEDAISYQQLRQDVIEKVIEETIPKELLDEETKYFINSTGRFVTGGPAADSGWTGKKLIVDTYGGYARHGGGSFSGKDPTKVDRSATYAARYVAKNIVAAGLAEKCEVQLAYAIGVAHPVSIMVDTFGTSQMTNSQLVALIRASFDLRPSAIIQKFGLRAPLYFQVSCYGHFGRPDLDLPWEKTDMAQVLKENHKNF